MVDDQVHDDADAALLGGGDQGVHVGHRPELGIDGLVVRDVVAVVLAGRHIHWAQPKGIDAQPLKVIKATGNPRQIADAIPVAVLKTLRVDLVNDGLLPPWGHALTSSTFQRNRLSHDGHGRVLVEEVRLVDVEAHFHMIPGIVEVARVDVGNVLGVIRLQVKLLGGAQEL
ncbi:Uncharacterised protein [Mycobacteroides abscessus subsp. abscessus]|nr:Uncharacterised protein [Mycobacteroides abscessus subsp. abscessus]